jgi:hypothetical protein
MNPTFDFYDVVRVKRFPRSISDGTASLEGILLGSAGTDDGETVYSVHLVELDRSWMFSGSELEATGRSIKEKDFHGGTTVRVNRKGEAI